MAIQDAYLPQTKLSQENYEKGFLIDHEWMAGISEDPDTQGRFWAFIVNHQTGEYVTAHSYLSVDEALHALNQVDRAWNFEATKSCVGGKCGNGQCGNGSCGKSKQSENLDAGAVKNNQASGQSVKTGCGCAH